MERPVEALATTGVAFGRARKALLDGPGLVFTEVCTAEEKRDRRFRMELAVDLGGGASVRQLVSVHLGVPHSVTGGLVLPVDWEATGRGQLLPTFKGELEALAGHPGVRLRLHGTYTVPLGVVGKFGDGVVGHRLARRSLAALVERLARRLESDMRQRATSVTGPREAYSIDLSEQNHSEIYVG